MNNIGTKLDPSPTLQDARTIFFFPHDVHGPCMAFSHEATKARRIWLYQATTCIEWRRMHGTRRQEEGTRLPIGGTLDSPGSLVVNYLDIEHSPQGYK